jgi:uncharacterized sporulation protein YeaH/YhbH (DUF444 family)
MKSIPKVQAPLENETLSHFLRDSQKTAAAVQQAVREAVQKHKDAGKAIVGWQDGEIVQIPAEGIVLPAIAPAESEESCKPIK